MAHHTIDDYIPLRPLPKVRGWGKSWVVRAAKYIPFRDNMQMFTGKYKPFDRPVKITVMVNDWNPMGDPENVLGGILDALKPSPLVDDSWRWIEELHIYRSPVPIPGGGFRLKIEEGRYAGFVGTKKNKSQPANGEAEGSAAKVQTERVRGRKREATTPIPNRSKPRLNRRVDEGKMGKT